VEKQVVSGYIPDIAKIGKEVLVINYLVFQGERIFDNKKQIEN
jgi:hypothetical protein